MCTEFLATLPLFLCIRWNTTRFQVSFDYSRIMPVLFVKFYRLSHHKQSKLKQFVYAELKGENEGKQILLFT